MFPCLLMWLSMGATSIAPWLVPVIASAASDLYVDSASGDDTNPGTRDQPLLTIGRALRLAPVGDVVIKLNRGTFSEATGERFPLVIAAGRQIVGHGEGLSTILGSESDPVVVELLPGDENLSGCLKGVTVSGGKTGVRVKGPKISWTLKDFQITDSDIGLDAKHAAQGLLELEDVHWLSNRTGLQLAAENSLQVTIRKCRFESQSVAGLLGTEGALATDDSPNGNTAPIALVENSLFVGNDVGIHLPRPTGDHPITVRSCEFNENVHYGIRAAGANGDPSKTAFIEDSTFRRNGIGIYLTLSLIHI